MCFENLCLYKFILETSPHSIHISSRLQRATRTHKQTYLWTGQRNTERKENTGNQSLVLLSSSKHWQANEMKWNLAYNTFSLQIRAKPNQTLSTKKRQTATEAIATPAPASATSAPHAYESDICGWQSVISITEW